MGAAGWALSSALLGALGVVLQQRGARQAPPAGSAGFVTGLLRRPVWLAGGACQFGCWACQGIALTKGSLSYVQPIASLQIVLALPLGVVLTGQRVGRREWAGAVVVTAGIVVFVSTTNATTGRHGAPADVWVLATGVVAALTAIAALVGMRARPAERAALYGAAAGVLFGFQAAVMNVFVDVAPHGVGAILTSWSTYGLVVSSLAGFWFMQSALQIGVLAPAIAASNAVCPITSVVLGRLVFLETPLRTTGGKIVSLVSAIALVAGLVLLARGEAVQRSVTADASG